MNNRLFIQSYNTELEGHSHVDYHQILMPLFGKIDLYIEDRFFPVYYGEAVFIEKGKFHQFRASTTFRFLVMNTETDITNLMIFDDVHFTLDQRILSYLNFLDQQLPMTYQPQIEQSMFTLLNQLFIDLKWQARIDGRLKNIVLYIQENIAIKHSIVDLSQKACLSPSRFKVLFKQQLGCTPFEYIAKLRMQKAIGLIRHTDFTESLS